MTTLIAVPEDPQLGRAQRAAVHQPHTPAIYDAEAGRMREQKRLDDYRRRAVAFAPVPRGEQFVDAVLADSFPASDAPPWTLGVGRRVRTAPARHGIAELSVGRAGAPTWWQAVKALLGAGVVVLAFAIGILVLGSVLALGVRLFVDVLAQTARMLLSLSG